MKFGRLPRDSSRTSAQELDSLRGQGADDEEAFHKASSDSPYIKDFAFYKTRFGEKHKEIKLMLREFACIVERFQAD